MSKIGTKLPSVTFRVRVRDESIGGDNPFRWEDKSTDDFFANKKVVVFSLPGAYTPTCSTYQLPGFENNAQAFYDKGVDEIYCISVNDSFVMNKWAKDQGIENVKVIPDGNGEFTEGLGMLSCFTARGFGCRSWRYAMVVDNGVISHFAEEPGRLDASVDSDPARDTDPYTVTSPEAVLSNL
jgi:peroxiredoxin